MTELPDGSGCFTATIMSKEEAMALPLKERPLNYRISSEMYHAVFEAIGEASMCWNPNPGDSVFASEQASGVATRLCFKIAEEMEKAKSMTPDTLNAADALKSAERPGFWSRLMMRLMEPRLYWEMRAKALHKRANVCGGWTVGRTDLLSFSSDGRLVHYAYPPDEIQPRVPFYGDKVTALKQAVRYAEGMNEHFVP